MTTASTAENLPSTLEFRQSIEVALYQGRAGLLLAWWQSDRERVPCAGECFLLEGAVWCSCIRVTSFRICLFRLTVRVCCR
jgi:hypothetical protein